MKCWACYTPGEEKDTQRNETIKYHPDGNKAGDQRNYCFPGAWKVLEDWIRLVEVWSLLRLGSHTRSQRQVRSCGDLMRQRLPKTLHTDLKLINWLINFICVIFSFTCMSLYHVPVCYTQSPEKGIGLPGTGVIDGNETPMWGLGIKPESSVRAASGGNC